MKKIFILILAVVSLLSSCGRPDESQYDNAKVKEIKLDITAAEQLCGVAYLGYMDGTFEEVISYLQQQEYYEELSFLKDISLDRYAANDGGELYCIIPENREVSIAVRALSYTEELEKIAGRQLISISDGTPILIKGNISEIIPNLLIEAKKDGDSEIFSPFRSQKDGKMDNPYNSFFDFTPYDLMAEFKNKE